MKLKKLKVENYKSVLDSNEFTVDDVTCLVGKNEAGKSAIIQALYKLNPITGGERNFEEVEYPRRYLATSRERGEVKKKNVLTTTWQLEASDKASIENLLGKGVLTSDEVTVSRGYGNTSYWGVGINEQLIVNRLLDDAGLEAGERASLNDSADVWYLTNNLKQIQTPTEKQTALQTTLNEKFGGSLSAADFIVKKLESALLPKFVYFRDYDKLPGKVSTAELARRRVSNTLTMEDRIFLALLDLANTDLDKIQTFGRSEEFILELEAVKNSLTDQLKLYWTQNRFLEVEFRYDQARPEDPPPFNTGTVFNTRILNTRHRATVNFDERSTGFIWFFSFLVWFSQIKKNYGENIIVLLDEPGLTLHGTAQKDLLNYINQRLKPSHQVIYTTHSPFMIDNENIFSLRTVEDVVKLDRRSGEEEILGTKVGEEILSRDRDTILPLQSKIGLDVANTLFLGPYVLVVEGPSENAYMKWFSRELTRRDREGLDVRWAIAPAEGAPKVTSFVSLFHNRGLEIAALLDYHDSQKAIVEKLEKAKILQDGYLLKVTDFVSQDEADIEDLIGREFYISLVNLQLAALGTKKIPKTRAKDANIRVVKEVEDHYRTLPPHIPEFDHYQPMTMLLNTPLETLEKLPGMDEALTRFESLFQKLNSLIE